MAEYKVGEGWKYRASELRIKEIRQKTRRILYGAFGVLKIEAMFKVMRRGIFKYEMYTTHGHIDRDLSKIKLVARL